MNVIGKLVKKLPLETGNTKDGKVWQKQSIVVDTGAKFNNIVCISAFGDKVERMNKLKEGNKVSISCNVYSREYNGKYYHNIEGYWFADYDNKLDNMMGGNPVDDIPF